jgi:type II secretory pathway pseudopilin PulG
VSPFRHTRRRKDSQPRPGYTVVDALVVLAVVAVVGLFAVMALARGRESARSATCQRNLGQIGIALAYYGQAQRTLPMIGEPTPIDPPPAPGSAGPGPLKTLLETLGVSSFLGIEPDGRNLDRLKGPTLQGVAVPGFFCASDPNAIGRVFPSPVSYRATTGDDSEGRSGGFGFGVQTSLAAIEAADGLSYTAAFSERLVGNGQPRQALENYSLEVGPIAERTIAHGESDPPPIAWRGDAGSSWADAGWPSTLYNHFDAPGAAESRVALDGKTASITASSGHPSGVGLLLFDGSVRRMARTINRDVWREFATVHSRRGDAGPASAP